MIQSKDILKKGTVELLVLHLLSQEDLYGYQITQSLSEKSDGNYTILAGSLYPILYNLAEEGYISVYDKQVGKRRVRKYYHLEEQGRLYYEKIFSEYLLMVESIDKIIGRKAETHEKEA